MTAPSLLDELAGVVKFLLGEEALDGRWFGDEPPVNSSGMKRCYWWRGDLRKAHADIAKRLEAAEMDAARYRWLRANCKREWESDMPHNKGAPSLDIDFSADGHDLDAAIDAAMHNSAREDGE